MTISCRLSQVRLLADPHGKLAKDLGLTLEAAEMLGTNRSKRYASAVADLSRSALAAVSAECIKVERKPVTRVSVSTVVFTDTIGQIVQVLRHVC